MKLKKLLPAIILYCALLFGYSVPGISLDLNVNNSEMVEKSDSTEINKSTERDSNISERKNETKKSKSVSKVSYNIIYYLIAKFILINPFTRPS